MKIYGDSISGNCLKVKWVADRLGLSHDWIETDIMRGESRTPAFLAINPAGQVPVIVLADGRCLAQSNAIILYLAEGSELIPEDRYTRARMLEWMFWEQYSHEPYIAVARFQMVYQGKLASELDPKLVDRGYDALRRLEAALETTEYLAGGRPSLADVALVAYTRRAHEGGFDMSGFPAVHRWIARVEAALGIV